MNNKELGSTLKQIAVYQELAGENPFKSRAFERAARIVEQHPESFTTLVAEDRLSGIHVSVLIAVSASLIDRNRLSGMLPILLAKWE